MINLLTRYCIFGLILLASCQSVDSSESSVQAEKVELSEEENIRLALLMISNPYTYLDVQWNDLVQYAIEQQWPVQKVSKDILCVVEEKGRKVSWNDSTEFEVEYTGTLLNGQVFDSSLKRGKPSSFRYSEVIAAWREGLLSIGEGGHIKLLTTSQMAYGPNEVGRFIKPYTPLVFDIKVVKVH